jgi:hypothetical protein
MMEAVRTSETSVDNHFTWQYIPEDNSEHHTRRRENLKSHTDGPVVHSADDIWTWKPPMNDVDRRKQKNSEKKCDTAT